MSFLPILFAFVIAGVLVSLIFWKLGLLLVALVVMILGVFVLYFEGVELKHYVFSFWLFILSEVLVFFSLLFSCLYFNEVDSVNLSEFMEIPFLGCFLLIGSSVTVTCYHFLIAKIRFWYLSLFFLGLTIMLGFGFVVCQGVEFSECVVNLVDSSYVASSFCAVGLHFSHVVIGLCLLVSILLLGISSLGVYYSNLFIWYWHFVDYIWLLVYTIVYVC